MKFNVYCKDGGVLVPCSDEDLEKRTKLKRGRIYSCEIKEVRNYEFHKKYFALIAVAWDYQSERSQSFFHNDKEIFRKTIEVAAGICDRVYSIDRREWLDVPKSISFTSMDEAEFDEVYNKVKEVIATYFLRNVSEDEFNEIIKNFW